jgi:hypothetical protein
MLTQNNRHKQNLKYLPGEQKQHVGKLYAIYLDAMKAAFDEGNRYIKYSMAQGNHDFDSALKIRSQHIINVAKKYEEFNIDSLARFFNVSAVEIRNATNLSRQ